MLQRLAEPKVMKSFRIFCWIGFLALLHIFWIGAIFTDISLSPAPRSLGQEWPNPTAAAALGLRIMFFASLAYWTLIMALLLAQANAWHQNRPPRR